jgi:hypothetical protein
LPSLLREFGMREKEEHSPFSIRLAVAAASACRRAPCAFT